MTDEIEREPFFDDHFEAGGEDLTEEDRENLRLEYADYLRHREEKAAKATGKKARSGNGG